MTVRQNPPLDIPIVCVSSIDFAGQMQRPQQIMRRYSEYAPVLYIEPVRNPHFLPVLRMAEQHVSHQLGQLWTLRISKPFPLDRSIPWLKRLNDAVVESVVWSALQHFPWEAFCLWFYRYDLVEFRQLGGTSLVVYDCMDDWSAFWQPYPGAREKEDRLVARSDVVFTSSARLYELKRRVNPHTYLVPNGVDFDHFHRVNEMQQVPFALQRIRHPIVGFVGALYHWIDLELIGRVARKRPEWSFVLVGPKSRDMQVPNLPNLLCLGEISYDELPEYLAAFDVCIMPFRRNRLTESVNPIKMYEYLATGKPIVSTGLPEVRKYAHLIEIADGSDEFELGIQRAIQEHSRGLTKARQEVAAQNSWAKRVETMAHILRERREELGV